MNEAAHHILVVDDGSVIRTGISNLLGGKGLSVQTAVDGLQALDMLAGRPYAVALVDVELPGISGLELLKHIRNNHPQTVVIMITDYPSIEGAVDSMKHGALDYLVKPFRADDLESIVQEALDVSGRRQNSPLLHEGERVERGGDSIVGKSPAMKKVFAKIERAAPSDSTVLLTGESGTGKELVARAIHRLSRRGRQEFVPVDCSALVETLLESELFGHVKGSFTGAHQTKHGLFELANQGTFFFDEITNLSLNIQAKLLRVIQEREFMKVGSQKRIKLDIRIIVSCNKDLRAAIKAGVFREDLYYRLSVVPIHLPPLRERSGDVPLLLDHFISSYSRKTGRKIKAVSPQALKMLCAYSWPGNVRELEHTVERISILEDCETIEPEHLPSFISQREGDFQAFSDTGCTLEQLEKRYIQIVLLQTKGVRKEAARILGINRKTLGHKIKKYDLRVNW
ncbi:MAG: sigma-54-dependent Fis family transcriptional regulator [Deltaproteobacteria bacterium]|nr:sigma-54-dependent Fis family transcriptional regulator [Deltaproteobacteria bacterium]